MTRASRALGALLALALAFGWWSWSGSVPTRTMPVPGPAPVAPAPVRPARTPPHVEAPPPQLIRDAPTRPDGLDRTDPCAPTSHLHIPMPWSYVAARREALDASLRAELEHQVGARVQRMLDRHDVPEVADPSPAQHRLATAAALAEGALGGDQPLAALAFGEQAIESAPDDPLGYLLASMAARALDDGPGERAYLLRALALAPGDPDIALHVVWTLDGTSDLMGTLAATDLYLDAHPEDTERASYRARLAAAAHVFADGVRRSRGPVTVVGGPALAAADVGRILDAADAAIARVVTLLGRSLSGELVVLVFPDAEVMHLARCGPHTFTHSVAVDGSSLESDVALDALRAGVTDEVTSRSTREHTPSWLRVGLRAYLQGPATSSERQAYARLSRREHLAVFGPEDGETDDVFVGTPEAAQARAMIEWLVAQRGEPAIAELLRRARSTEDSLALLSEVAGTPLDEASLRAFLSARSR